MRFFIDRATIRGGDECPTEGAIRDGDNWVIELNTLEELIALSKKEDENIILGTTLTHLYGEQPSLLIYDDYIE